ncbi:MAG: hypothetical protein KKA60_10795 [Proteobacteria bacterium]|nr:hypothetical protein [Pseudomonadota bacterium]
MTNETSILRLNMDRTNRAFSGFKGKGFPSSRSGRDRKGKEESADYAGSQKKETAEVQKPVHPAEAYPVAKAGFPGKRLKQPSLWKEAAPPFEKVAEPPFDKGGQGGFLLLLAAYLF